MCKKLTVLLIAVMLLLSGCSKSDYSSYPIDVKTGDVLSVKVSMEDSGAIKAMALSLYFDDNAFELIDGKWLNQQAVIADFNIENKDAAIAFSDDMNYCGDIFEFKLKAKTDITVVDGVVDVDAVLKNEQMSIECKGIDLSFAKK